jgi:hypothetical protein
LLRKNDRPSRGYINVGILVFLAAPLISASARAENSKLIAFSLSPDGSCPKGWQEATNAKGRIVLSVAGGEQDQSFGKPFRPEHPPTHTHRYRVGPEEEIIDGDSTRRDGKAVAIAGAHDRLSDTVDPVQIEGDTTASDFDFPFFQAVLCEQKQDDGLIDVLPKDSVMYFVGPSCPTREERSLQWVPYEKAQGRFIVPLVEKGTHEAVVGNPWSMLSFKDNFLDHKHMTRVDIEYPRDRAPETAGGEAQTTSAREMNKSGNGTGEQLLMDMYPLTLDAMKDGFPFYTLTVCRKEGTDKAATPQPPPYFTFFRATGDCGDYAPAPATMGHFLVALPQNALPDQAFGTPLKDREERTHTHGAVLYTLPSINAGGTGPKTNSALNKNESSWMITPPASHPNVPYIQLSHCTQKISDGSEQKPAR